MKVPSTCTHMYIHVYIWINLLVRVNINRGCRLMWGVGLAPRACAVVLPRGSVCLLGETDKLLVFRRYFLFLSPRSNHISHGGETGCPTAKGTSRREGRGTTPRCPARRSNSSSPPLSPRRYEGESDAGAGGTAGGDPPTAGATPRRASGKWDGNSVAGWLARSGRRSITSGRGITRARARGESRRLW